ncbi:hypothetical protein AB0O00_24195, partial [Kitasatospora sp. NPDC093558]
TDPASVAKAGKNAFDGLAVFQLGCAAPADQRGAFAFQPDAASGALAPNALATAQASLAAAGGRLPVGAGVRSDAAPKPLTCQDGATGPVPHADSGEAAAAYLTAQLGAGGNHLSLTMPGATPTPDYNATAWAALGLTQSGHPQQAAGAVDWLTQNASTWTKGGTDAGAAATLLLVGQAAQRDTAPLVQQLTALGPAPKTAASAAATPAAPAAEKKKDGGIGQYWLIGVGLLIGIGGGLILSLQRKRGPKL